VRREFKDRTSWYDGYLFEKIMEKRSSEMFVGPISALIEDGSSVIDIGCGIGSLVFNLSPKCSKVTILNFITSVLLYCQKPFQIGSTMGLWDKSCMRLQKI